MSATQLQVSAAPDVIPCAHIKIGKSVGRIMMAGPVYTIRAEGSSRSFTFEWHPYHGPARCNSNGELAADPSFVDRSGFWPLFNRWMYNGKQVDQHNRCILGPVPPMRTCEGCDGSGKDPTDRRRLCDFCHGDRQVIDATIVLKKAGGR